jgi:TFIIF-interacting CTD phosphatase-like protein
VSTVRRTLGRLHSTNRVFAVHNYAVSSSNDRLLILDLDETLIHGAEAELDYPCDFRVGPYYIYRRPHLTTFLKTASQWFTLAIWSSSTSDYASAIAREILPGHLSWRFIWGRERCIQRLDGEWCETVFLKDLKKVDRLGFDRRRVLCIDDMPAKVARNYGNAIYVSPFEGDRADDELVRLLAFLESIRSTDDYRRIEKRGWRQQGRTL